MKKMIAYEKAYEEYRVKKIASIYFYRNSKIGKNWNCVKSFEEEIFMNALEARMC